LAVLEKEFGKENTLEFAKKPTEYRGQGCKVCNNEGYKGRIGIFEILQVSEGVKELIFAKESINKIELHAKSEGFKPMMVDGLAKVQAGLTTLEEVLAAVRE
jgi:type II secretory ATPase GspE/PulE/Tfp pilus assembly ATPase PilB-like protein